MLQILVLALTALTLFAGQVACKSNKSSASFTQGKRGAGARPPVAIDRSKQVDINAQKPANAITKGSFTVWTQPQDPRPEESYQVVIEVRLPQDVTKYDRRDLSGSITGTDGYVQEIGEEFRLASPDDKETLSQDTGSSESDAPTDSDVGELFSFVNGQARLSFWVPGAETLVKDVVDVRSKVLNERQEIAIVF